MKKSLVVLFLFGIFFVMLSLNFGSAVTNVSACGTLNTANEVYTLNQSISGTGTCITIGANNITLDCQGYTINYSTGGSDFTFAIRVATRDNATIKNCRIVDGNLTTSNVNRHGVYFSSSSYLIFYNNSISINKSTAGYFISLNYSNFTLNNFTSVSNRGILGSFLNTLLSDNIIQSISERGLSITTSINNTFLRNNISSNSSYGFYATLSTNNAFVDNNATSSLESGFYITDSWDNNFTSNTGISNSEEAFYFNNVSNSFFSFNNGTGDLKQGIYFESSSNNTLTGNVGRSVSHHALYMLNVLNFTLTNNLGTSAFRQGITFIYSNNSVFINNTGVNQGGLDDGIDLVGSSNNLLIGNNGTTVSLVGLELASYSNNNTLINNTGTAYNGTAIYIYRYSNYNTLINNTGISITSTAAIDLFNSSYNVLINNTAVVNVSSTNNALSLVGSTYNSITNHRILGLDSEEYSLVFTNSSGNIVYNCINISRVKIGYSLLWGSASFNNTIVNCSYNLENETIDPSANGEIIRKWYYKALVNSSSGANLSGVVVSGVNSSEVSQFSSTTDSSGWTEQIEVTDYVNVNGTRTYYSNYTISASLSGYDLSSKQINFTSSQNKIDDYFILSLTASTTETQSSSGTGSGIIFRPSQNSLQNGWKVNIGKTQKVQIPFGDENKIVEVESITNEKIIVSLDGKDYEITNSSSAKIDLDNDGFYDLEIMNNGITGNYANLKFTFIHEEIPKSEGEEKEENVSEVENKISFWNKLENFFRKIWNWIKFWK